MLSYRQRTAQSSPSECWHDSQATRTRSPHNSSYDHGIDDMIVRVYHHENLQSYRRHLLRHLYDLWKFSRYSEDPISHDRGRKPTGYNSCLNECALLSTIKAPGLILLTTSAKIFCLCLLHSPTSAARYTTSNVPKSTSALLASARWKHIWDSVRPKARHILIEEQMAWGFWSMLWHVMLSCTLLSCWEMQSEVRGKGPEPRTAKVRGARLGETDVRALSSMRTRSM